MPRSGFGTGCPGHDLVEGALLEVGDDGSQIRVSPSEVGTGTYDIVVVANQDCGISGKVVWLLSQEIRDRYLLNRGLGCAHFCLQVAVGGLGPLDRFASIDGGCDGRGDRRLDGDSTRDDRLSTLATAVRSTWGETSA